MVWYEGCRQLQRKKAPENIYLIIYLFRNWKSSSLEAKYKEMGDDLILLL